jgi:hypothetical protein
LTAIQAKDNKQLLVRHKTVVGVLDCVHIISGFAHKQVPLRDSFVFKKRFDNGQAGSVPDSNLKGYEKVNRAKAVIHLR